MKRIKQVFLCMLILLIVGGCSKAYHCECHNLQTITIQTTLRSQAVKECDAREKYMGYGQTTGDCWIDN
ncbi:hypothetical protein [Crocinitomix catalasitica]|uniref:hypothetical protein n=1 Tax=Crocinitomix catalasitica TaxID=184607 RepID=UPI0004827E7B|nr:hypothetical protein [Crocinitomix catalasitica]